MEDKTTSNQQLTPTPAPVNQNQQPWPEQTPTPAKVQYVIAQKSLNGVGGLLTFWIIFFSFTGLAYITTFFAGLANGISNPSSVLLTVFSPFIAAGCITSVVFTALRKRLGKLTSIATIGLITTYAVLSTIVGAIQTSNNNVAGIASGIFGTLIFGGLMILYFVASKRVRQTLIV